MLPMRSSKPVQIDPLYTIFEQHLYNFQDSDADRKTFIGNIINEYLTYLRRNKIVIPRSLESQIVEELAKQVNSFLVKKIYGFLTIEDYQKKVPVVIKRKARDKYGKLGRARAKAS
jgi:hypothetical protein